MMRVLRILFFYSLFLFTGRSSSRSCQAFVLRPPPVLSHHQYDEHTANCKSSSFRLRLAYNPPAPEDSSTTTKKEKRLYPNVGDIIRFYDLDGGEARGEILVGRISFISKNLAQEGSGWTLEIAELDDVGDGYYTDYGYTKRKSKKTIRDLAAVSPVAASFVRSEDAYKVPLDGDGVPKVRTEFYDIDDYPGPFAGENAINMDIVQQDAEVYGALKSKLLRYAALAGLTGTVIANLVGGTEDAIIYAAGALASLLYLFFLTVKTDTVASEETKLGNNVSNLRFVTPLLVVVGVAFYNKSLGDANPVKGQGSFDLVTTEQFAAAILGFLTYRIPLFLTQVQEALKDDAGDVVLPGSAGMAMQLAKSDADDSATSALSAESMSTVFLVSGPQATGRSELVNRLIEEGDGKFVRPKMVDRVQDSVTFERLEMRDEFLSVMNERSGLTKDGILNTAKECGPDSVVVIDADVELARRLLNVDGIRLVAVWVGLNSVVEFESRLGDLVDSGAIPIGEDETRESIIRARVREIVQEIEFGISSGIFEFTVINQDENESLKQLREAAAYCFK